VTVKRRSSYLRQCAGMSPEASGADDPCTARSADVPACVSPSAVRPLALARARDAIPPLGPRRGRSCRRVRLRPPVERERAVRHDRVLLSATAAGQGRYRGPGTSAATARGRGWSASAFRLPSWGWHSCSTGRTVHFSPLRLPAAFSRGRLAHLGRPLPGHPFLSRAKYGRRRGRPPANSPTSPLAWASVRESPPTDLSQVGRR
jgi:hypothetical protein